MSTSSGTAPASTSISASIKDIRGRKLPIDGIKRLDKFYVELVIDGESKHKTGVAKGNMASWTESFYFDALSSSMLECRLYAKNILRDKFIGGTKDAIELLLAEGTAGVITRELCIYDSQGNQRKTQIVIEFTIAVTSKGSDAAGLNMEEAVAEAKDALAHMKLAPSSIKPMQGAVNTSVAVVANINSLTTTWGPFLQKIKLFTELVDGVARVHPYANMAWSILSVVPKTILAQVDRDSCIVRLVEIMDDVFSFVKEAEPIKKIESHGPIIELMSQQATECAYFIRDYAMNKSLWKRTLKNSFMSDADSKIKQYEDKFNELKSAFQDRAILQTEIIVSRVFGNLNNLATDFNLHDIPYANGARFDPAKGCLPGTRDMIIKEIIQWVNSPNGDDVPRIFLLSGVAGSGKSAIAHTIAKLFYEQKRLGSSYCFARADQANRRPDNLFSTITLNIADIDDHWKMSLGNIVKGDRSLRTTVSATEQFKKFILEPAMALTTVGPILVVIDALDESAEGQSREDLLETLAKGISDLPSNFRILMTARPEPDIVNAFKNNRHTLWKYMDTIDEAFNKADITLFVETHLSDVSSLEEEWPNKRWCQMLVESSEGLFQWASTACRAIKDPKGVVPQTERLSNFVKPSASKLDGLYSEVLRQAFHGRDDDAVSLCKLVMGWILATKEPLSITAHSNLRGDKLVESILPQLGSFLSGVDQQHSPIRPLHASFFEFLTDQKRSTETYYVDPSQQNRSLTLSCLRVMKSGLQFNIAGLETSDCRNADVPDLATRIEKAIPPHLSYGCRFWANHLGATAYDTDILKEVKDFLHIRLLYWLEVLSLIKKVNMASGMLLSVLRWNQVRQNAETVVPLASKLTIFQENIDDIASFASDAMRFAFVFGPPISQSAPHIYLSALPFAPKNSLVAKQYLRLYPNTLCLKTGKADHWPASISVFGGHADAVSSVAFSQDSKRIVSGSYDQTIRVWDAETGEVVVGPLKGHTEGVSSVAFSQDSRRIVSGSWDQTIRVWDAETGKVVVGPLKGHTDAVSSVAFSRDSKHIVSGSEDQTIRVWDAQTGKVIVGPLKGHTDSVDSVAFSQDNRRVVSGSLDQTIRVWDTETGKVIVTLKGHTAGVSSAAFSHDGKRIISGSQDQTIRVWDAQTGKVTVVGGPKGHAQEVNSVSFSQDSKRIVSGSEDQTILVWDAQTGEVVGGPLKGHTDVVYSVAFSQDSKRIVSGSEDQTIRVWDAETREVVVGPLKGHTDGVISVAFSQDSKRIVSGSYDHTIRVWDAETGEVVIGPLEGHTNGVLSVAFSQDSKRIVSGSFDQTIQVWDAETGEVDVGPLKGHTSFVNSVAFSQDSTRIVSGSEDQTIRVWDAETGDVIVGPFKGHTAGINSIAFSQDSRHIVSGSSDHTLRVWDAETGEVVVGLKGHTKGVNSVAFSQDSKRIVSGSADQTIRIWDAETGEVIVGTLKGHTEGVNSVAFSHDGKRIVSGSEDQTILVWGAETGEVAVGPLKGHTAVVCSVAFSQDSKRIVSGSEDQTIRVWDAQTREIVIGPLKGHTDGVISVAFSQDSKRIVSGSYDHTIRVWDAETGEVVVGPLEGHTNGVLSVAFSQDSTRIVSGSFDQTIQVWDAETGEVVVGPLEGHTSCVNSVAFSQDSKRIVSGSDDQTILVWDAETGDAVVELLQEHTSGKVNSVAFSQDSKRIVSGSDDQTIRIWDAETGEVVVGPLKGHTEGVNSVAFSQDSKRIVSGSWDQTIRVWDAETGEVVRGPLKGHTDGVISVAFSQDSKRIVSGSVDQTIRVWDAETGEVIVGPLKGHTSGINSVAFSQDSKRIVSGSFDQTIRVWDAEIREVVVDHNLTNSFTDTSTLADGWIHNSSSELLFWVPPWTRPGLCWPRNPFVIAIGSPSTHLNLDNFVHGNSWQQCHEHL